MFKITYSSMEWTEENKSRYTLRAEKDECVIFRIIGMMFSRCRLKCYRKIYNFNFSYFSVIINRVFAYSLKL